MVLSSQIGLIGGFGSAMILIFLEKGMPVSHRAVMNLLAIPFLVIYFFLKNQILPIYGTLIDTKHIKSFGKSKTYVLFMPLIYVPGLFLLSFQMIGLLEDINPWPFFGIMMIINFFVGTYWVSVDCWIPTLFPENLKARGSYGRWFGLGKLFF
jgi:MFS family permease